MIVPKNEPDLDGRAFVMFNEDVPICIRLIKRITVSQRTLLFSPTIDSPAMVTRLPGGEQRTKNDSWP